MRIKEKLCKNWYYIVVFLIPWVLVVIHSILRESWLSGNGSILAGEAGNIYYEMYAELWNKVHNGGSLFFTWNAGLGIDFLVNLFYYLMSPFTLIVLIFPKNMISNVLQFIMIMKWSLIAVTMLYYLLHTKHNQLRERKKLVCVVLALAYSMGNAVISGLSHVAWLDVMIIFPLLLLLVEKLPEGKGFKRFYLLVFLGLVWNFQTAIPMMIFLTVWFGMHYGLVKERTPKCIIKYIYCLIAACMSDLLIIVPCVSANINHGGMIVWSNALEYAKTWKMTIVDFFQRFFVCDSLLMSQQLQPMLYCGVVTVAVALLYLFVPVSKVEQVVCTILGVLLCFGFMFGGAGLLWYGYIGNFTQRSGFAFLLTFLLVYMAMQVLARLESLRKWNLLVSMFVCVGGIAIGFFKAKAFLDFYVYLASLMLIVLILLLLFFFCKKSILYKNMLVVFSLLCMGEVLLNAYYQLGEYNMYPMEESYYNQQSEVLANSLKMNPGERLISEQTLPNYGMVLEVPNMAVELENVDTRMINLTKGLGCAYSDDRYMCGGSPLVNFMFNIKNGMSQNEVVFSDVEKAGENNGYALYGMNQSSSLGYMVSADVLNWKPEDGSPFTNQNDYVEQAAGADDIFEIITPDIDCTSVLGINPEDKDAVHVHSDDEDASEHAAFHGKYHEEDQKFHYSYYKMFDDDGVKMEITSDGVTDYYVFVESDVDAYYSIMLDEENVYTDEISSRQKTFHLGIVKKGTKITIETNAVADLNTFDTLEVTCQIAAFHEENYKKAYEKLSSHLYEITEMTDTCVKGNIETEESGVMMTSIPALDGFTVYVDGNRADCETIGDALIGVPLEKGEHVVEFKYATPNVKEGAIGTVVGLCMIAGFCLWDNRRKRKTALAE